MSAFLDLQAVRFMEKSKIGAYTIDFRLLTTTHRHIGHGAPGIENNAVYCHHTAFERHWSAEVFDWGLRTVLTRLFLFLQFVQAKETRARFIMGRP